MTWQLPDTYHLAGHGRGTATLKFYEGRDILVIPARPARPAAPGGPAGKPREARADASKQLGHLAWTTHQEPDPWPATQRS